MKHRLIRIKPVRTALAMLVVLAAFGWSPAGELELFRGTYDWNNGGSDKLLAEFRPDGDGQWKVTFKFRFGKEFNSWKGSAKGDLTEGGEVSGTTSWEETGRTWVFRGTIEEGVFNGTHAEVREDKETESGTFSLRR